MPLPGLGDRARTSRTTATSSSAMNVDVEPPNSYRERVREKMQNTPRGGGAETPIDDRYNNNYNQHNSNFYDNRAPIDLNITREFTFFRPSSSSRNQSDRLVSARSSRTPRSGQQPNNKRDIIIYNRTYADGGGEEDDENEVNLQEDRDYQDDQEVRAGRNGRVKSSRTATTTTHQSGHHQLENETKRRNSIFANRPESRESFYSNGNNNNTAVVPSSPRIRSSYLTRRISRQANGEDDIIINRPVKTPRQQLSDLEINGSRYNLNNPTTLHHQNGSKNSRSSRHVERHQNLSSPEEMEHSGNHHHQQKQQNDVISSSNGARHRTNSPTTAANDKFASNSRVNFGNGGDYEESFVNEEAGSAYNSRTGSPDYRPVPKPRRLDLSNKTNLNLTTHNENDGFKIRRNQSATVSKMDQTAMTMTTQGKPRPTTPRLGNLNMPVPSPRSSLGFSGGQTTRNITQQDEYFSKQRERNNIMTSYMHNNNNQRQPEPARLRTSRRIVDELSDESAMNGGGGRENAARSVSRSIKLDTAVAGESRSSRRNSINQSWK